MAGKLELEVGGMFAEKSTALIRKGRRKLRAGKKVVFVKPQLDDRYSDDAVVTHDGVAHKALNVWFDSFTNVVQAFHEHPLVQEADVVCIDEVQFFPDRLIEIIDMLLYSGKDVYCAGLDLDRFAKPFGITPVLMARAEKVTKHNAVCGFCGSDAWVTIGTENLNNNIQVNVGNDYIPACRTCAEREGGVR